MSNHALKERKQDNPYEIWTNPQGWEWRVLKKWQVDDAKPYGRWFCAVRSPFTYGDFEYGDTYVKDVKENAILVYRDPNYAVAAGLDPVGGEVMLAGLEKQ